MSREVFISRPARIGFREAQVWLTQPGSGAVGWSKWAAVRDAPDALVTFPYRGQRSADYERYRQLIVFGYRILYRVDPDTGDRETAGDVYIVAVFSPGTLPSRRTTAAVDHNPK